MQNEKREIKYRIKKLSSHTECNGSDALVFRLQNFQCKTYFYTPRSRYFSAVHKTDLRYTKDTISLIL